MKEEFSAEGKRIIGALFSANKPLTTKSIAERSEMAWSTVKKYLGQAIRERGC